jgi:hypothetical protein
MALDTTTDLADASFVTQTMKDALRLTRCPFPRCGGVWVRDLDAARETYLCDGCATRWTKALG